MDTFKMDIIPVEWYEAYENDYAGFCIECGTQAECVESDARNYECEECGKNTVYGMGELLIMGYVG